MTVAAVAAILALSVLPAEHVHASPGGALVHRHVIDDGAEHAEGSFLDHSDHASVQTLDPTFNAQRPYGIHRPLIVTELVVAPMVWRLARRAARIDAAPAHGPPIPIRSLRAPPA